MADSVGFADAGIRSCISRAQAFIYASASGTWLQLHVAVLGRSGSARVFGPPDVVRAAVCRFADCASLPWQLRAALPSDQRAFRCLTGIVPGYNIGCGVDWQFPLQRVARCAHALAV